MKVALFCVLRNEQLYASEYIDHYIKLGIDHIYFVDNSIDDSLDSIIANHQFRNYVSIINIRSKSQINKFTIYQAKLYTSLYNIYSFKYDWLCFFDIDEYLVFNENFSSIKEYIDYVYTNSIDENYNHINIDQIHVNCKVFDDNNNIYYENKPLIERFKNVSQKYYDILGENANGIKSILKTGLDLHFLTCHTAISNTNIPLNTIDNDGFIYDEKFSSHKKLSHIFCQLNHYITKSTEEYCMHKNLNMYNMQKIFDYYFMINEYSIEKENYIKNYFNII